MTNEPGEKANIIAWETMQKQIRAMSFQSAEGTSLGPWRTYDPPPVYLKEACRVIDLETYQAKKRQSPSVKS
jgi:hypothetical protein